MNQPFFPETDVSEVTYTLRGKHCVIELSIMRDVRKEQPALCNVSLYTSTAAASMNRVKALEKWPIEKARQFAIELHAFIVDTCDSLSTFHESPVISALRCADHASSTDQIGEIVCALAPLCPTDAAQKAIGLLAPKRLDPS
jgi:hypothetical protein